MLRRGSTLVFCEVKTRTVASHGGPAAAVTADKRRRIKHLARRWRDAHPEQRGATRFDLALISAGRLRVVTAAF